MQSSRDSNVVATRVFGNVIYAAHRGTMAVPLRRLLIGPHMPFAESGKAAGAFNLEAM
jgi:hypothetical protein